MGLAATALVGMGLTVIGGMHQAEGERASGQASADAYSYQTMIARNNAALAKRNAQIATEAGDVAATAEGMKTAAEVSHMKAETAASGVDVNTGSAVAARDAAIRLGEINALTIKSNKAREAWGYEVDASNEQRQAALDARSGGYAKKSAGIASDSTLLSTAGSVFGQFQKFQTSIAGAGGYPEMGGTSGGLY